MILVFNEDYLYSTLVLMNLLCADTQLYKYVVF